MLQNTHNIVSGLDILQNYQLPSLILVLQNCYMYIQNKSQRVSIFQTYWSLDSSHDILTFCLFLTSFIHFTRGLHVALPHLLVHSLPGCSRYLEIWNAKFSDNFVGFYFKFPVIFQEHPAFIIKIVHCSLSLLGVTLKQGRSIYLANFNFFISLNYLGF